MATLLGAGDINRLDEVTSVASGDYIPLVDVSTGKIGKATADNIASGATTLGNITTGTITSTGAITGAQFIDSTAISTASTSTTMAALGASLLSSTAATTFPLAAP